MRKPISLILLTLSCVSCIAPATDAVPDEDGRIDGGFLEDAFIGDAAWTDALPQDAGPPPTCDDQADALACEGFGCAWWRAPGEAARCHEDPRPSACDQPDGPTCEAAGCEWTGIGCAPSLTTPCGALGTVACAGRTDCVVVDEVCAARPDAACGELAQADCEARNLCGWLGAACVALDPSPCPNLSRWSCEQRNDCAPIAIDGCGDQAKGGAGASGGGGGGAGGGAPPNPSCNGPADCEGLGASGCFEGYCTYCDTYVGCQTAE